MSPWEAPVSHAKPGHIKFSSAGDFTPNLKRLLGAANICSKRWIFEQYDTMVQSNTVEGPGADTGVMRLKGSKRGLAMALDGDGSWAWLSPKAGAMHAVAEATRNVSCTGVSSSGHQMPDFGNPEKPNIMWQFSEVIDGISAACEALDTPITGGNVSLYNETLGEGIYPTPVVGIVGIVDDIENTMTFHFRRPGQEILSTSVPPVKEARSVRKLNWDRRVSPERYSAKFGVPTSIGFEAGERPFRSACESW